MLIYSSLGVYLGIRKDRTGIVDAGFILEQFSKDPIIAKKKYLELVKRNSDSKYEDTEFRHERSEYRSERKVLVRNSKPKDAIDFVATYTKQDKVCINIKYIKKTIELKALCALFLRGVCDMKQKDICRKIGSITQAHASRLCLKGLELISNKDEYRNIIKDFLEKKAS